MTPEPKQKKPRKGDAFNPENVRRKTGWTKDAYARGWAIIRPRMTNNARSRICTRIDCDSTILPRDPYWTNGYGPAECLSHHVEEALIEGYTADHPALRRLP